MDPEARTVSKVVLPGGLTVVMEPMPHVRSVTVGVWVKTGSRAEPPEVNGLSHFLEHMVFKGTEGRTAEQIAREVDSVGGHLDAYTAKELVCFSAKVMDEHLDRILDVLADLVLAPRFRAEDIEKEQGVILEEIKMEEDSPDSLVQELFLESFWPAHSLGRPILGRPETVRSFHRERLFEFFRRWYVAPRMLVSAAGHLEPGAFLEKIEAKFARLPAGAVAEAEAAPRARAELLTRSKKELEQAHVCLGVPSYPLPHPQRYACAVLNTILGGGMSSRLFQNVREKEGLAYAIYSDLSPYRDAGCLSVYAGTSRESVARVVELVMKEFRRLKEEPVAPEELRRAKDNLKGSLILSLESTSSRMSNLARQEIYFGQFIPTEEILARLEAVTAEELQQLGAEFFHPELVALTVLGPLDGFQLTRAALNC